MWKSVSPLYRDRGCILRSGAKRRRHVTTNDSPEAREYRAAAAAASEAARVRHAFDDANGSPRGRSRTIR